MAPISCAPWLAWPQGHPLGEEGMEEKHIAPQSPSRSHQTHPGGEQKSQDTPGNCTQPRAPDPGSPRSGDHPVSRLDLSKPVFREKGE